VNCALWTAEYFYVCGHNLVSCVRNFSVHFWVTVCKMVRPMLSDRCLSCLSVMLVYCGQTIEWIKMELRMEVGLRPGHIVLDGDPAPPKKGCKAAPTFWCRLFWPNGWMDQDATWYRGKPWPRPHCVTWESSYPKKGHAPNFRPMSTVAKHLPISATAEHLFHKETWNRDWKIFLTIFYSIYVGSFE